MNEEITISKRDEICKITEELKSHFYKNDFIDPDKKFISLLQKITVIYY